MKQDKNLLQKILVAMVNSDHARLGPRDVYGLIGAEDSQFDTINYHLRLLEDDGYIVMEGLGVLTGYRVTSAGQARFDWYESNRDPFATA
ncbi:hypothetical protein I5R65_07645 [Herbaspirillum sp. AP02]|uniref:hypothetical protein n=1 Tax=unclassified Herbaspirillum TaxID=2624150 RepID=UPI0015DA4066|nr:MULTISPECIES: hypothetical protein [unclassified Herbaspirillum]MBG7619333.1 hypothetical protein [Herbaspirillum sp. AP02]NZD66617.1 hypothetical protein [Herbaspirillum sp. AP21]